METSEEVFHKNDLLSQVKQDLEATTKEMETANRNKEYAIQVYEAMARRDQSTLSQYILRLEKLINRKMAQKNQLQNDVYRLRTESEKMRYTDEEQQQNDAEQQQTHDNENAETHSQSQGPDSHEDDRSSVSSPSSGQDEGEVSGGNAAQAAMNTQLLDHLNNG